MKCIGRCRIPRSYVTLRPTAIWPTWLDPIAHNHGSPRAALVRRSPTSGEGGCGERACPGLDPGVGAQRRVRGTLNGAGLPPGSMGTSIRRPLKTSVFPEILLTPPRLRTINLPILSHQGAYPDRQRRGAGCGGRWQRQARQVIAGRVSRERSYGPLTNGAARTAKACGSDASMVGVKSRGGLSSQPGADGHIRGATEARKPDTPGRARHKP